MSRNLDIAMIIFLKQNKDLGASKSTHFSNEQNETAILFKSLGHPARIAIIEHIILTKGCICNDLVDVLPLTQSTISQHLRELKLANIIQGSISGNSICYCLNDETLKRIQTKLNMFIETSEKKTILCC